MKAGTIGLALAVTLSLAGCATLRREEARSTEDLLVAAGFSSRPADTPEKVAKVEAMPALKVVSHVKDGNTVYTYADPYNCRCLYVGDPQAYQRYQRLAVEKQIADEERWAAEDWAMWGPWWW